MGDQDRKTRRRPPGVKPPSEEDKREQDKEIDKGIDDLLKEDEDLAQRRKEEEGE
ncbi:MAG: hypothetical protein HZC14_03030 [Candidatus Niyogibacteria bacterium]|nr:hypothetical protein [Candidatus Niyogibacteria bacterium]